MRKPVVCPSPQLGSLPMLDRITADRVTQWVTRWHGADYDPDDISEMLEGWPADISLNGLIEEFTTTPEAETKVRLASLVLQLISFAEKGRLQAYQVRGAYRLACRQLCTRGIPFEETAKGDESALWFHFLASNEFGDPENLGYITDLTELRLIARLLVAPAALAEALLAGEFPPIYHDAYVSIGGVLADSRLTSKMVRVLRRCEDAQSVAATIHALGRLEDRRITGILESYAYSTNTEISIAAVLALEALAGPAAERILRRLNDILPDEDTPLTAHVTFSLLHLQEGPEVLRRELTQIALDEHAPTTLRLIAIERLSNTLDRDVIRLMEKLLDDPTMDRVKVDGLLTDDVVHTVREAAYMALIDCRIATLVEVLGEGILDRLESFQMYAAPSWWGSVEREPMPWESSD